MGLQFSVPWLYRVNSPCLACMYPVNTSISNHRHAYYYCPKESKFIFFDSDNTYSCGLFEGLPKTCNSFEPCPDYLDEMDRQFKAIQDFEGRIAMAKHQQRLAWQNDDKIMVGDYPLFL